MKDYSLCILGLGNEILKDDAVGILLVRELEKELEVPEGFKIDFLEASLAGFNLLDILVGYDGVFIIDSIVTGKEAPGTVMELDLDSLKSTLRLTSVHDINLATALKLGEDLGMKMPSFIKIYVLEVLEIFEFGEELSEPVKEAFPLAVVRLKAAIEGLFSGGLVDARVSFD